MSSFTSNPFASLGSSSARSSSSGSSGSSLAPPSSSSSSSAGSSFGKVSEGAKGFTGPGILSGLTSPMSRFSSNKYVSGTKEFLESNSIVAKFAFLLLALIVFIVLLRVGTYLISLLMSTDSDPMWVDGMVDSRQMIIIPQNPNTKGAKPIKRSVGGRQGLEFTWVCWIYIDDLEYKRGQYRHVFHKGSDNIHHGGDLNGVSQPNNAPGLYIGPDGNELSVMMNTFDTINEEIVIKDIPVKKWVCVIIRCAGHNLDVFINGTMARRHVLSSVPKQNYGDVYVSMNGGFSGNTSSLQYFDTALGMAKIQDIVNAGPDLTNKSSDMTKSEPKYLSSRWFFIGTEDGYNP